MLIILYIIHLLRKYLFTESQGELDIFCKMLGQGFYLALKSRREFKILKLYLCSICILPNYTKIMVEPHF